MGITRTFGSVGFMLILCFAAGAPGQAVVSSAAGDILGLKLRFEVRGIIKEIEARTGKKIYAGFEAQPMFQFGASFVDEDGLAVVLVDPALERDPKKLEAVVAHELLHLRLTVNNYPGFIWSPSVKTAKGRAVDVEQSNINDLRSIIEHRIFKADMERLGLNKFIDLSGDTASIAKNQKGQESGQADSINYARAILEYLDAKDVVRVRLAFEANGWKRAVNEGAEIADIINRSALVTAEDVEAVFLRCIAKLYPSPGGRYAFSLSPDRSNRHFRRMIVNIGRAGRK